MNEHVAGENAVWLAMGMVAAWLYLPIFWQRVRTGEIFRAPPHQATAWALGGGIALEATGGIVHRFYWMIWRWFDRPEVMSELSFLATTPAICLIWAGYSLHAFPYLTHWFPRFWWGLLICYGVSAYWVLGVLGARLTQ